MGSLLRSFRYALRGLRDALGGRNFRIMVLALLFVLWTGWVMGLDRAGWAVQLLCCGLVLALECVNTGLEALCDRVNPRQDPAIGRCKDCAAGASLAASAVSVLIWLIFALEGDRPARLWGWLTAAPWRGGLVLLSFGGGLWWALAPDRGRKNDR